MERRIIARVRPKTDQGPAPTRTEATDASWADWRWHARHARRDLASLSEFFELSDDERRGIERSELTGLPLSITPYYLSLCNAEDPSCPIRRQCVPTIAEGRVRDGDLVDPLGEVAHEVAPHLVQRYPDRVLLLVTDHCGVYCRFCTRSRMVGQGEGAQSVERLQPAFDYIQAHPSIREVIISGGDPGLLSDARIHKIIHRLAAVEHISNVRFATRTPVTLPQRVTPAFCEALRAHPSVWLMTHFNHPRELTDEATQACAMLADTGIPVMNQTVLLRGINDEASVLEDLFRGLVRMRVRPYYLLQMDPVRGTAHLRTPLRVGIGLMSKLQGRLSGIALPKFIVDTPGGKGKVHIAPNPIVATEPGQTTLETFRGEHVDYIDPPETNL